MFYFLEFLNKFLISVCIVSDVLFWGLFLGRRIKNWLDIIVILIVGFVKLCVLLEI